MPNLKPGDKAPNFTLKDQNGNAVSLLISRQEAFAVFLSKADTSGCTKQACSVRDAEPDLSQAGIAAVGISPDKPDKQKKFDDKYALVFRCFQTKTTRSRRPTARGAKKRCTASRTRALSAHPS